jgi:hypothetical protein
LTTQKSAPGSGTMQNDLVVLHRIDGTLRRGILEWETPRERLVPPAPLPDALHIRGENEGESHLVQLSDMKAVFFVKRHEGTLDHDEVKFFSNIPATDLWIRVEFADGEVLEGRTENNARLLFDAGVWLRPFDSTGNNVLVYVPKSSVVEFHVMGVAVPKPSRVTAAAAGSRSSL